MGDAGSYLVGFLIAVAMLMATYAGTEDRPHAVLAPLCAMAVPLYDMSTVLWIRIREGRSPFVGDRSHFSHRLVDLGLSRTQAVLTIYLVTATCGLAAILLTHVSVAQAVDGVGDRRVHVASDRHFGIDGMAKRRRVTRTTTNPSIKATRQVPVPDAPAPSLFGHRSFILR